MRWLDGDTGQEPRGQNPNVRPSPPVISEVIKTHIHDPY